MLLNIAILTMSLSPASLRSQDSVDIFPGRGNVLLIKLLCNRACGILQNITQYEYNCMAGISLAVELRRGMKGSLVRIIN